MKTDGSAPGAERRLKAEARLLLFVSHYGLRLFGFRRLVRTLGALRPDAPDALLVARVAGAVNAAADQAGYSCLRRAFAADWMLRLRGRRATLHYGVRRGEAGVEAHAWLDLNGLAVVGHEQAKSFALLNSFPSAEAIARRA